MKYIIVCFHLMHLSDICAILTLIRQMRSIDHLKMICFIIYEKITMIRFEGVKSDFEPLPASILEKEFKYGTSRKLNNTIIRKIVIFALF